MTTTDFRPSSVAAARLGVLTLSGEIDLASAPGCLPLALTMVADCQDYLTVDLSDVTFIDSTGLGMLLDLRAAANDTGNRIRLRGTPDRVQRLLDITGLADLFQQ